MKLNTPILRFEHLSFRYRTDRPPLLTDFCLEIPAGGTTAMLGPNGAGKSTLLFLTLGWLKPLRGQIWLDGKLQQDYTRREKGQFMSLVPQREQSMFAYSVLEYVLLGRAPCLSALAVPDEADYAIAFEALRQAGLDGFTHRNVLELSGGEHQMLLLARALTQKPRLLLLDEPTTHLDLYNKAQVRNLLQHLQQQGVTIVMTTHEPELALELASHAVLLHQGRVLHAGSAEKALTSERLSQLYQCPVQVAQVADRRVVLW
jgi:iron complex transport system ATP-binding protein